MVNLDPARLGAQVISGIGFWEQDNIMKDEARFAADHRCQPLVELHVLIGCRVRIIPGIYICCLLVYVY